jgi:hypothetical protein
MTLGIVTAGHRDWPLRRFGPVAAFTLAFRLGCTVFSEWLNIVVRKSCAYSDLMPVPYPVLKCDHTFTMRPMNR